MGEPTWDELAIYAARIRELERVLRKAGAALGVAESALANVVRIDYGDDLMDEESIERVHTQIVEALHDLHEAVSDQSAAGGDAK